MARVAAPGGRIIIVAWCHRNLEPSETSLKPDELSILKRICNAYYFPEWCSASEYVNIAKSLSLEVKN
jgi:tocopherol O-methyltransferase